MPDLVTTGTDRGRRLPQESQPTACYLPDGVEIFTIPQLVEIFSASNLYWTGMIESGQLYAFDLRSHGATKAMFRIPRAALVAFLEKRVA